MQHKGILAKWNDDRGFGFIRHSDTEMVFVHISAVKNMPRRPKEGDTLSYDVITDESGKKKAACVTIEGLQRVSYSHKKKPKSEKFNLTPIVIVVICVLAVFYYKKDKPYSLATGDSLNTTTSNIKFSCQGKTHCSQMTSCEEAMFYLANCPNQQTDGNGDGEPCESQWCN